MIILWASAPPNGGMFVWASTGYHTKVDLAKTLIERNHEMKELGIPPYYKATNEKAEEVIYEELMREIEKFYDRT